ncbi:MAG TPA: DUF4834 family protein [Panacibacter sp.]|nr:DUF4834 family protein [Panacibacter sp.]HNP44237.1 DUF4834 family protein [Panacibacter sp.]
MLDVIVTILILYLLYKLIFDFIVPVAKTTSQVKQQFNNLNGMREEMLRRQQQQQNPNAAPKKPSSPPKQSGPTTTTTDSEYIDFEEIK